VSAVAAADLELQRTHFERFARGQAGGRSPLWAEVCAALAADDELLELMRCAPAQQRRPTLLLAAIHDLLLAGTEHELAAHVPTVAAGRAARGRPGEHAIAFCREHREALAGLLATRATQTNEVNRAAALLPALVAAAPTGSPLRLVELGASAGLNLLVDRFAYRYVDASGRRRAAAGGARGGVVCACVLDGSLPALEIPHVAERIGVDLSPLDVCDDDDARWLLACVWPDDHGRVARLRAAIELARRDPPRVVRGDATALLDELAGPPRDDVQLVIWHSWALAYGTPRERRALVRAVDALGAGRDLTWLYLEPPSQVPELPAGVPAAGEHEPHDCALVAVSYRGGRRTARRLADAHPHVHRLRWHPEPVG
jgi:hypothetical protein